MNFGNLRSRGRLLFQALYRRRARHLVRARARSAAVGGLYRKLITNRAGNRPIVVIGLVEHLGDIVACRPVSAHVRRTNPDSWIVWPVREAYRPLVDSDPNVDESLELGCLTEWMHVREWRIWDRVVDLHVHGRSCEVCRRTLQREDPCITLRNYYDHGSLLEVFSQAAGLPRLSEQPRLEVPPEEREWGERLDLPCRIVVFHGVSNQASRDWADGKWSELIARLNSQGVETAEIGLEPIVRTNPGRHRDLCGLPLLRSAEVLRRARVYVGVDSGPAHLANAVDTRGVVLLGDYSRFGNQYTPYTGGYADGSNATLLRSDGPASSLSVDTVERAVLEALEAERLAMIRPTEESGANETRVDA